MKRTEIGSEFWDVPVTSCDNNLFISDRIRWFVSGTAALEFILEDIRTTKNIKKACIPSWCCSCMIEPFVKRNIEVVFYPVFLSDKNELTCDFSGIDNTDITLELTYFGYNEIHIINHPSSGVVIRDVTHSIFCNVHYYADYWFGSLRKWAGFWTGGFAGKHDEWTIKYHPPLANQVYINCRSKAMEDKRKYIGGIIDNKEYLLLFDEAEAYLDSCGIKQGTERDIAIARKLDITCLKNRRRRNASFLLEYLKEFAVYRELKDEDCPLFVPITVPNDIRDELRQFLINKEIYCPIHWPITNLHSLDEKTKKIYDTEISIVCDQRYELNDMERIICEIHNFGLI